MISSNFDNFYIHEGFLLIRLFCCLAGDISTSTPQRENERGAMEFSYWKLMGSTILIKTNINNWIRCSPSGK